MIKGKKLPFETKEEREREREKERERKKESLKLFNRPRVDTKNDVRIETRNVSDKRSLEKALDSNKK